MRKRLPHQLAALGQLSVPLCLALCFGGGVAAGCFFAGLLGETVQTGLSDYLNGCFTGFRDGNVVLPSLLSTLWELCRWPLLVFLFGFTALGVLGVPAVFLARGFLMSYAVSVLVRLFGGAGFLAALVLFGLSGVFVLPALFILGSDALRRAAALAGSPTGEGRRVFSLREGQLVRVCSCCGLLVTGTLVQLWLAPVLLQAVAELLA